uniref:U1 small nuclear ribonucleoprotein 70 kDa n=1 Tax=Xenopus laevis TaxID=8355 RepID=RU17_XENLA|nr:RecName: Full=U1 small nuclear ribonucleoprotein 70 kDa; Short=U1 snRNP 70 kDa; Short=U1-70K; Short=snRNP70 [Xenopus laevis]CAA30972.1 U1 70K [Xenopus laevis]
MTQFLPPNLLALFAPRDPVPYLPPLDKLPHEKHHNQPYCGIAPYIREFEDPRDAPPPTRAETREERMERKRREKIERRQQDVENELKIWDPHNDQNAQGDAFKTLFVARVNYDTTESKLRREFEVYGPIKRIHIVYNKGSEGSGKPRGYAFIEYEHERDMHSAYKHADGKKIDGRRVLVDVERGRTVKGWRPRRLGGGLGGTRRGGADVNIRHSGRDDTSRYDERDRERERDRRERSREREKEPRERRRSRSRERRRKSRSREKEERKRTREKSKDKDKEKDKDNKDRDRKRRSRSRERKRERDRDREKKEERVEAEVPEADDAPQDDAQIGDLGIDGIELKQEPEEKSRERDRERDRDREKGEKDRDKDRDRDRDRRRSHRDRDREKDRDRDRDRRRDRDRDRERDKDHKRERDRGDRSEKREERVPDNGMVMEQAEETSQDMYLDQESMQSGDGYLSTENGYMMEPPME